MALTDFTIFLTLHTTPTKDRQILYKTAIWTALQQGCGVVLMCDFDTEEENIEYARSRGIKIIQEVNVPDSGMHKVMRSIELCKTKWCAILQDDDAYVPNRIRMINEAIFNNQELNPAIIYTDVIFQQNGIVAGHKGLCHVKPNNVYHTPPSKWIINTELVKDLPLLDEFKHQKWGWDYILALLICQKGKIVYLGGCPIVFNIHSANSSNVVDQTNWMEQFKRDHPEQFKIETQVTEFRFL